MKVRMRLKISGTRGGEEWPDVGDTINVPESEAADLIRLGLAEATSTREAAVAETTETTSAPRPRGRPRKQQPNPED